MNIGDKVKKNHVWDGSQLAGKPMGPILTIINIEDHKPVDGPIKPNALISLSDGSYTFEGNLTLMEKI